MRGARRAQTGRRLSKREIGIAGAQHRTRRGRRVVLEDDGRRTRRRERLLVFRIGQERHVPRLGVLYAGYACDFEFTVSLEPAVQSVGQFVQFHLAEIVMPPGVSS